MSLSLPVLRVLTLAVMIFLARRGPAQVPTPNRRHNIAPQGKVDNS